MISTPISGNKRKFPTTPNSLNSAKKRLISPLITHDDDLFGSINDLHQQSSVLMDEYISSDEESDNSSSRTTKTVES